MFKIYVFYWVARMAIPVGKLVKFDCFSVTVKVLLVTSLLSGVFVSRVFWACLVRFAGGNRKAYISPLDTVEYFINLQQRRRLKRKWCFGGSFNKIYSRGAQEWNFN